jgi:hypothetical protein
VAGLSIEEADRAQAIAAMSVDTKGVSVTAWRVMRKSGIVARTKALARPTRRFTTRPSATARSASEARVSRTKGIRIAHSV